ncbi:alpha/beta hydrolase [Kribbella sp. NPDC003557]|uniref:alpha/beta hydrolase n=1 Tax=Kribbella sp. NPDC003557 TaxID=3154449 RepID=UPI0033A7FC02
MTNPNRASPSTTSPSPSACGTAWNAPLRLTGPHGHLNSASTLGRWQEGRDLLDTLIRPRPRR